jgi:cobalt/nickel transport protein
LTKPFGLYEGNVFQGIVKFDGQPVPFAEVEVEFYNREKTAQAPTEYMITQTIKADQNGVFTYAAPHFGWWGFAALNEADYRLKTDSGQEKGVELGAVLWVHFEAWGSK